MTFLLHLVISAIECLRNMAIGGLEHSLRRVADNSLQTLKVNWHLGFTSFGGPPVHFKIVRTTTNHPDEQRKLTRTSSMINS